MGTNINMPSAGQTTNELLVTAWHKNIGDTVHRGDVLFSIESDKATMDIESYAEGTLLRMFHEVGDTVSVGEPMAYIGAEGESAPEKQQEDVDDYVPIPTAGGQKYAAVQESASPKIPESYPGTPSKITASPAARKAAADAGITLKQVADETGRLPVKRSDVMKALENKTGEEQYTVSPASPMRKTIAGRMMESVTGAPQYFVSVEINMEAVIALRTKLNGHLKETGIKVAYHDILMKCACVAIKSHPLINSSYDNGNIRSYRHVHFALAVGLPGGLVVPVLQDVDCRSITEIAEGNARNIERARSGSLKPEEMSGSTITLSNLGMYGVDSFTAILNRPEACILAASGILEKPVVRNGVVTAGQVMTLTGTFDHRLIDGAEGAAFLQDLKRFVEQPELLLL
ncbi:dihydrolipoamide acetyltransferase component of pyruvate dehydrogenase complex [Spirochaetia bacterium]|nr:dihydrolipoamide acetyltransferase component of pyruvate dehydrogenase complex [Spirochaetia bacterium]